MKNKFVVCLAAVSLLSFGSLVGCGKKNNASSEAVKEFSFSVALATDRGTIGLTEEVEIKITEENNDGTQRSYSFVSSDPAIASVSETGLVTGLALGKVRIEVTEAVSNKIENLMLTVTDSVPGNGGYNYASLAGEEAIKTRTEILGKLEKYAMDKHLTGITLFENGGYVKYSARVDLPTTQYITGYGFGLLSEGRLTGPMAGDSTYPMYLHAATSSDPKMINARNDTGSQVSDLEGYITSSFWGTKMNATKDQYVWYPVLAKDTIKVNGQDQAFNRPVPVYEGKEVLPGQPDPNPLGLYKTWRIYVKTGATDARLKYRYSGNAWNGVNFDQRNVALADYEYAYRLLLTGSHALKRGKEMAKDETYGILGASAFNSRTEKSDDAEALTVWDSMKSEGKLGVKTGTDATNGEYIELTILNAIDRFTAMYTLSSNLLSPIPEDFIKAIGSGSGVAGAPIYGTFNNNEGAPSGHRDRILDYVLSVGPYMLEHWDKGQMIVFKKNNLWTEANRYNIEGVKLTVIDASSDADAIYKEFNAGNLDSCGIPIKHLEEEKDQPRVYKTKGDATFKLNVNSCTQSTWNELFGSQGKINKGSVWEVKPWMSNDNFLKGLFYSIDRKTFAGNRGVNPSINYFADSYLSDPENGKSYNDTEAHKEAISAYEIKDSKGESTYGYSRDKAVLAFKTAVEELSQSGGIKQGTRAKPKVINIHIKWMYQTDIKEYGEEIKEYFESAFNDDQVCGGTVKLEVTQDAVTNWQDVYNEYLMKGQFDLGFGAISGNSYNPLNFLEVLKSDNSSGFTLNWGTDTSKLDQQDPIIYQGKMWSFDGLWAVADHGGVVENGEIIKPVKEAYMSYTANDFNNGATFTVPTKFFEDKDNSVKFEISRVSVYVSGKGNTDLTFTMENGQPKVVLSQAQAQDIVKKIQDAKKIGDPTKDNYDPTPFKVDNYGAYWTIEIYYTISIKDQKTGEWGTPTENYVTVGKNIDDWKDRNK